MKQTSLIALALISASYCVVGCGGSNSVAPTPIGAVLYPVTTADGSTLTQSAVVPDSGGVQVVTGDSATGGNAIIPSGAVAAGTALGAGTQLAVIPRGFGFEGSFTAGSQVTVNNNANSGITVGPGGLTTQNVALPVTDGTNGTPNGTFYSISFPSGSLNTISPTVKKFSPKLLTIQTTQFNGQYYVLVVNNQVQVISPVPTSISGAIPNNGQNAAGSVVACTFGNGNNGRSTTLHIDYGNGFTLSQVKVIANNRVTFRDLQSDSSNVPKTGIRLLEFTVGPRP